MLGFLGVAHDSILREPPFLLHCGHPHPSIKNRRVGRRVCLNQPDQSHHHAHSSIARNRGSRPFLPLCPSSSSSSRQSINLPVRVSNLPGFYWPRLAWTHARSTPRTAQALISWYISGNRDHRSSPKAVRSIQCISTSNFPCLLDPITIFQKHVTLFPVVR